MISIHELMKGIGFKVDIEFDDQAYLSRGNSGTGKTFMFSIMEAYCDAHEIKCCLMGSSARHKSNDEIINMIDNSEIVLLDNADLYINDEILEHISKLEKTVLISIKHPEKHNRHGIKGFAVKFISDAMYNEVY